MNEQKRLGLIAVIPKGKRVKGRETERDSRERKPFKRRRACRHIELFFATAGGGGFQAGQGLSAPQQIYPTPTPALNPRHNFTGGRTT